MTRTGMQNKQKRMGNRQKLYSHSKREGKSHRLGTSKAALQTLHMQKSQRKNQRKAQVLQRMKPLSVPRRKQEGSLAKERGRRR